jgi:hypothetical protein
MDFSPGGHSKATFGSLYTEAALYKAVIKVYTKPLFYPRKAVFVSHDNRTLYHFARHAARNVEALHRALVNREFHFREGIVCLFRIGVNRPRTLYIFPWEERIVDQLLYQMLNKHFDSAFSKHSYAYRYRGFGVDICQRRIARFVKETPKPYYIVKRDAANFFPSLDHEILLGMLAEWVEPEDYLFELLRERVKFQIRTAAGVTTAERGVAFGNPTACFFGNLYLTPLDREMTVPGATYHRYGDDMLILSQSPDAAAEASQRLEASLAELRLRSKASHRRDLMFPGGNGGHDRFAAASSFQHLGLEFCSDGRVRLPRAKVQKLQRLFRRAFRRALREVPKGSHPEERLSVLVAAARDVLERGIKAVAIIDYYLKHVDDERQLQLIDRWIAEEVLAQALQNGHTKGNFRMVSFRRLRALGLPSLRHRRRLLRHGWIKRPIVVLAPTQDDRAMGRRLSGREAFSPGLKAAAYASP